MDVALDELKENIMPTMTHLLCHWHLNNNLIKHFSWLNNLRGDKNFHVNKRQKIYKNILQLGNIDCVNKFHSITEEILKTLKDEYSKSYDYIQHFISIKHKWSKAFITKFTAASFTTSRAESIHAHLKKIYKSPQELNFIFDFISIHEKNARINYFKFTKAETNILTKNLTLNIFNNHYTSYGMRLIYDQFIESMSYEYNQKDSKYDVFRKGYESRLRIVEKTSFDLYDCPCKVTLFNGVICRHIFAIIPSIKDFDATKYLHPKWNKDLQLKPAHPKDSKNNNNIPPSQSTRQSNDAKTFDELSDLASLFNEETKSNEIIDDVSTKIMNPETIRRKGRPKGRAKSFLEKNKKRKATKEKDPPTSKKSKKINNYIRN